MEIERKPKKVDKKTGVVTNFKVTHRNDPCPCGSGNKFKKCCLNELGTQGMFEEEERLNQLKKQWLEKHNGNLEQRTEKIRNELNKAYQQAPSLRD